MREASLVIPGEVVPKQSMRVHAVPYWDEKNQKCAAMIKAYQKKEVKQYEELCKAHAKAIIGDAFDLMTGPLKLKMDVVVGIPKSMTKKDQQYIAEGGFIYKWTRPDLTDNLIKGVCDALEDIVYVNDGQIAMCVTQKYYGFEPRAIIHLKQIPERFNPNSLI